MTLALLILVCFVTISAVCASDNVTDILKEGRGKISDEKILDGNQKYGCAAVGEPATGTNITYDSKVIPTDKSDEKVLPNSTDDKLSADSSTIKVNTSSVSSTGDDNPLYGIVDFGSNGIKLKIFEVKKSGKISTVISKTETSVVASYAVNNTLTQEGITELISILKDFDKIMNLVHVKEKYVFATASLRKITNADEVVSAVKEKTGIVIDIISGEKEAITTFNAAKNFNELSEDDGVLIDLGGGSCEVIDFLNKTPVTMESMPIGSMSCYKEYVNLMFPDEREIEAIQNRVLEELSHLTVQNDSPRNDIFVSGGSGKVVRDTLQYLGYIGDEVSFDVSMLDNLLNEFRDNTKENYLKILSVSASDINTIIPGLIVIRTVAHYFDASTIHICKKGVGDGIVKELIDNSTAEEKCILNIGDFPSAECCLI